MKFLIFSFYLLSAVLLAEEMQLNLPERFDAKIVKGHYYSTEESVPIVYDKKFYEYSTQPQSCRIVHFEDGKFYL